MVWDFGISWLYAFAFGHGDAHDQYSYKFSFFEGDLCKMLACGEMTNIQQVSYFVHKAHGFCYNEKGDSFVNCAKQQNNYAKHHRTIRIHAFVIMELLLSIWRLLV